MRNSSSELGDHVEFKLEDPLSCLEEQQLRGWDSEQQLLSSFVQSLDEGGQPEYDGDALHASSSAPVTTWTSNGGITQPLVGGMPPEHVEGPIVAMEQTGWDVAGLEWPSRATSDGNVMGSCDDEGMEAPPGAEAALCDFSDLLDSFAVFLDAEVPHEALPEPGAPVDFPTDAPGLCASASPHQGTALQSKLEKPFPSGSIDIVGNRSSSTSSSSQCAKSASAPLGLAASQSEGATSSNSNSHSSSNACSGDSGPPKATKVGGPTLLAKLKDLCKGSSSSLVHVAGSPALVDGTGTSAPALPKAASGPPAVGSSARMIAAAQSGLPAPRPGAIAAPSTQPKGSTSAAAARINEGDKFAGNGDILLDSGTPVIRYSVPPTDGPELWGCGNFSGAGPWAQRAASTGKRGGRSSGEHGEIAGAGCGGETEEQEETGDEEGTEGEDGGGKSGGSQGDAGAAEPEERLRQQRLLRNRQSALQSRQRRKQYLVELEQRCRALEAQVSHMGQIVAMTALENGALRDEMMRLQHLAPVQGPQGGDSAAAVGRTSEGKKGKGGGRVSRSPSPPSHVHPAVHVSKVVQGCGSGGSKHHEEAEVEGLGQEGRLVLGKDPGRLGGASKRASPVAMLEAEPAALYSDSLPSESLLPQWCQPLGVLFSLHLFCLLAASAAAAVARPFLISLCQCLLLLAPCPGLCLDYPSPLSAAPMLVLPKAKGGVGREKARHMLEILDPGEEHQVGYLPGKPPPLRFQLESTRKWLAAASA